MTTYEIIQVGSLILTAMVALGTIYNGWQHQQMRLIIAELQLNLRREFNGRYVLIDSFEDAKERIERLEASKDAGH